MDGQSATVIGWILDLNRGSVGSMAPLLARFVKSDSLAGLARL